MAYNSLPTLFLLSPRTRSRNRKHTSTAPVPLATRISGIFIAFPPLPALSHKADSPCFIQYLSVLYTLPRSACKAWHQKGPLHSNLCSGPWENQTIQNSLRVRSGSVLRKYYL